MIKVLRLKWSQTMESEDRAAIARTIGILLKDVSTTPPMPVSVPMPVPPMPPQSEPAEVSGFNGSELDEAQYIGRLRCLAPLPPHLVARRERSRSRVAKARAARTFFGRKLVKEPYPIPMFAFAPPSQGDPRHEVYFGGVPQESAQVAVGPRQPSKVLTNECQGGDVTNTNGVSKDVSVAKPVSMPVAMS